MNLPARLLLAAAATLAIAAPAHADIEPDPQHGVSLTFSPVHLLLPMLELQGEFRVSPNLGVAVIGGVGGASITTSDGFDTTSSSVLIWELGAKAAWYAVGDFEEGLQVAVEALYLHISLSGDDEFSGSGIFANGFSVSPLIGYKIVADVGFTFEAQLGPAIVFATASSDTETAKAVDVGLNLNLNIGWSF